MTDQELFEQCDLSIKHGDERIDVAEKFFLAGLAAARQQAIDAQPTASPASEPVIGWVAEQELKWLSEGKYSTATIHPTNSTMGTRLPLKIAAAPKKGE